MPPADPATELDPRYSSPDAIATPWAAACRELDAAAVFWLTTVRPDSRPHVTTLLAVWWDGAAYFCTGATERKARNLDRNPNCILTTGSNRLDTGLDVVIEGTAMPVRDDVELTAVSRAYDEKYGSDWHFDVRDGGFVGEADNVALVYKLVPSVAFGFGKGAFSQTRWTFPAG